MKTNRQVFIYAFNNLHRVEVFRYLEEPFIGIRRICEIAEWMVSNNDYIRNVYVVDNRPGLKKEFDEAMKSPDFARHVEFEDSIACEGIWLIGR